MPLDDIEELESYVLFQEINDTFTVLSDLIKEVPNGLLIKDTFIINEDSKVQFYGSNTPENKDAVITWLRNKLSDVKEKIMTCIDLTDKNFQKFKAENPEIKEEMKNRIKDLKKAIVFIDTISFEPMNAASFYDLLEGPVFKSDYAGINVKETKYFLL